MTRNKRAQSIEIDNNTAEPETYLHNDPVIEQFMVFKDKVLSGRCMLQDCCYVSVRDKVIQHRYDHVRKLQLVA